MAEPGDAGGAPPPSAGDPLWVVAGPSRQPADRLGTAVVTTLVDLIVSGRYAAGATLPTETELGAYFGVSRTVVRESVKLLQAKGLVSIRQGIGTVVSPSTSWNMIDDLVLRALVQHDQSLSILDELVEVRAMLERDTAAGAAAARTDEHLERMRAAFAAMEDAPDEAAFTAADADFHDAIMEASGKRLSRAIVTSIHDKARTTGRYQGEVSAAHNALTFEEHRRVLEAIENGDADAAADAVYTHIVGSWARRRPRRELGATTPE
jgi:GntR family transcriptional regulator, galactonate operon transcriptional repressor